MRIDLNADLGEGAPNEEALMPLITSANISCGLHAGDPLMMRESIRRAVTAGVAVGAHPSLNDRENFGRTELPVSPEEIFTLVVYQLGAFCAVADAVQHVKPHGALYNMAARDPQLADAVARAAAEIDAGLILFAPPNSALARAGEQHGLRVAREVFADRNYLADGSLVPRSRPDALLHDAAQAADRVVRMLREGFVRSVEGADVPIAADTVCIHGDTPEAVEFARMLRSRLAAEGVVIAAPNARPA